MTSEISSTFSATDPGLELFATELITYISQRRGKVSHPFLTQIWSSIQVLTNPVHNPCSCGGMRGDTIVSYCQFTKTHSHLITLNSGGGYYALKDSPTTLYISEKKDVTERLSTSLSLAEIEDISRIADYIFRELREIPKEHKLLKFNFEVIMAYDMVRGGPGYKRTFTYK